MILNQQLKKLPELIRTYSENAAYLTDLIRDIPGIRVQKPGRLADPQGYYSLHFIFDGEDFADIPKEVINEICSAEGIGIGCGTHGPVYRHALFNLNLEKGEYRIHNGECRVCESLYPRTLGIPHNVLLYRRNMELYSELLHKIHENREEARQYAASKKGKLS